MKTKHKIIKCVLLLLVCVSLFTTTAFALEVPISQTEQVVDGKQLLTKVFEVSPEIDPQTLIEDDFEQNGFLYSMTSIVKNSQTTTERREVTKDKLLTIETEKESEAQVEAIRLMPEFLEYNEDGYVGKLYPHINSITWSKSGTTPHSGYNKITRQYTYFYNDDSLVPEDVDGYTLSSIDWSVAEYEPDSTIPKTYTATATYQKKYSYSTTDGWIFTITYSGEVEKETVSLIQYTITYTGTEIMPEPEPEPPTFTDKLFGQKDESGKRQGTPFKTSLGIVLVLLALGGLGVAAYYFVNLLRHGLADVFAQDESGKYVVVKRVRLTPKQSTIRLTSDEAKNSSTIRVVLDRALAEKLKGLVVSVMVDQTITRHQIEDCGGSDYVFEVNVLHA